VLSNKGKTTFKKDSQSPDCYDFGHQKLIAEYAKVELVSRYRNQRNGDCLVVSWAVVPVPVAFVPVLSVVVAG
jgi:hypothetical protein